MSKKGAIDFSFYVILSHLIIFHNKYINNDRYVQRVTNINQVVWKVLQQDLAIQKDMWRKIINTRALAKYLIKKYSLLASLDSVISAIRRFQTQDHFEEEEKKLHTIFKQAIVSTKNNVCCMTIGLTSHEFLTRVCKTQNTVHFRISTGEHEFKLVTENPSLQKIKGLFSQDEILGLDQDLSEVSVVLTDLAVETKGVLARIATELTLANINIQEIIITPPEFLIYVKQKDIVKAHESILKLANGG